MTVLRWPFCAFALALALPITGTTPSARADEPTTEWVRTGPDTVMDADTYDELQESEPTSSTSTDGIYAGVNLGDGFTVFAGGLRNYGDYMIHLINNEGNIENFRDEAQEFANEVNARNGLSIQVAAGTFPPPADPNNFTIPTGQIWMMISTQSPCGPLVGSALGCGGVRGSTVIDGISRWTAGVVWLNPGLSAACDQPVILHELGHALGLNHFDELYMGQTQLMKSSTSCTVPNTLQAGDLNGVQWLAEPTPSNDSVASAALVCPDDSSVSANTWFATKESLEPAHAGSAARRSVWYRYVPRPEQHGLNATISTSNDGNADFDTELAVYTGSMPALVLVASDNDGGPGNLSSLTFPINSAATYLIAVDGVGFARGETDVVFALPPVADDLVSLCAPARLLDTRIGGDTEDELHEGVGRIGAGQTYTLPIAGRVGIPSGADSVVLNVTAVSPSTGGFITVFPCGPTQPPTASNLNFSAGDVRPNLVIARVGSAQSVCFFTSAQTDLLVDVSGYFPLSDALVPLAEPGRLLDTRIGGDTVDEEHEGVGRIAAGTTYALPVVDRAGADVPADAETVVLNVTAVLPSAQGFLTVFPCGEAVPKTSNLNYTVGKVIPNAVLARVGAAGSVCFYASQQMDLLVDVSGYFPAADVLVPLAVPQRVLDTRIGGTTDDAQHQGVGRIAAGATYELPIAGRVGVHANAISVVLNVTVLQPSANGFVTVFACGQDRPNASNLNYKAGNVVPNAVLARLGTGGKICIYASAQTDLLVDVSGYFL